MLTTPGGDVVGRIVASLGHLLRIANDVILMCRSSSQASLAHTMFEEQRSPLLAAYVGKYSM